MKKRIDAYLFEQGHALSREKAKILIMCGAVYINGVKCTKPSSVVPANAQVTIRQSDDFVSRGGKKLQKALDAFNIDVKGKVAIDIGASTGGFTDCLLRRGAKFVYSVDVGYGQIAWQLRYDSRVCVMERQNARFLTKNMFDKQLSFCTIDVSFISLKTILPIASGLLTPPFSIVALIKPQFEAGRESVGKNGVVRDNAVHIKVINDLCEFADKLNLCVCGIDFSPIKGPKGNIEYLIWISDNAASITPDIDKTVEMAHKYAK